jgi:hypothetical protein
LSREPKEQIEPLERDICFEAARRGGKKQDRDDQVGRERRRMPLLTVPGKRGQIAVY